MARINRVFQYGFLFVATAAAYARTAPDWGERAEMFLAMLILAGFLVWALTGYLRVDDRDCRCQRAMARRRPVRGHSAAGAVL
jgi:hypothetical protein